MKRAVLGEPAKVDDRTQRGFQQVTLLVSKAEG